jgi:hypothetical protein
MIGWNVTVNMQLVNVTRLVPQPLTEYRVAAEYDERCIPEIQQTPLLDRGACLGDSGGDSLCYLAHLILYELAKPGGDMRFSDMGGNSGRRRRASCALAG